MHTFTWAQPVRKVMFPLPWPEGRMFCCHRVSYHLPMLMNQLRTANHRLHKTALRQILPAYHHLCFLISGESRHLAQSVTGLHWSSWFTPQDTMLVHGKRMCPNSYTYWAAGAPALQRSQAGGRAAEQRGEKETRVTAPGAEDLGPWGVDHCQSFYKRLGFQCKTWSPSPPGSYYRDPLLPTGAGTRREPVLLAHLENLCIPSALGHSQLLCIS